MRLGSCFHEPNFPGEASDGSEQSLRECDSVETILDCPSDKCARVCGLVSGQVLGKSTLH